MQYALLSNMIKHVAKKKTADSELADFFMFWKM